MQRNSRICRISSYQNVRKEPWGKTIPEFNTTVVVNCFELTWPRASVCVWLKPNVPPFSKIFICLTSLTRAKWNFPLNFRTMCKLSDLYSGIFQNSLTCAKWNFPLNFHTMHKLSDLYSGIFQNSLTCAKWNFPLNFHTMHKLSDLYSGIFQNYWLFNHLAFNMRYSF